MKTLKFSLACIAIVSVISCKKKSDDTTVVPTSSQPATTINKGTKHLGGYMNGILYSDSIYYLDQNLYIKKGDSLTVQAGATVIATNKQAGIYVSGVFQSLGTQVNPVTFTVPTANQDPTWGDNSGAWGGIQCDSNATSIKLLWSKIMWTGGPDASGSALYSLAVHGKANSTTKVIIEDSWFYGGGDDGLRLEGPIFISIRRNSFQHMGSSDGETINIKRGATGDVCYNYIWSAANNGIKLESNSAADVAPYTNVNVYNNTVVSSGFRKKDEPTASVLVDNYANGSVYNNIFVNNHQGLRITSVAKTVPHGNNLFYSSVDSLRNFYYPQGDAGKAQTSDIISTGVSNNNPMFVHLDLNVYAASDLNDAHLQSSSPAKGKGNTGAPYTTSIGTPTAPNTDLGAFPSDGSGNKH